MKQMLRERFNGANLKFETTTENRLQIRYSEKSEGNKERSWPHYAQGEAMIFQGKGNRVCLRQYFATLDLSPDIVVDITQIYRWGHTIELIENANGFQANLDNYREEMPVWASFYLVI